MARFYALLLLVMAGLLIPDSAHAFSQLQCQAGQPVAGTALFDDSSTGACQFTGIRYIFSTIICEFVSMINVIMGKLYCSIQAAVTPIVMALATVYVVVYGVQMLMGTSNLRPNEAVTRVIKLCLVLWLCTDPAFGVSAGISYMFNFFIAFISDSTRWVVKILDNSGHLGIYNPYSFDPGVTASFKFLDDWIYGALTGTLSQANARVIGFFVAMTAVMPSIAMMALYWWISMAKMLISTLISFLMAIVAVSFLLGLSPIFLSFMLFQITFQYFDQWLRFMASFSLQVMVSFAILTLWIFTLMLFAPFFNELSTVLFPYQKFIRPAAAIYAPSNTWGLCPFVVTANPIPSVQCINPNFNPIGPADCDANHGGRPCYALNDNGSITDQEIDFGLRVNGVYVNADTVGKTQGNADYNNVIPPSRVPEMSSFLYFIFYHMLSLIIVCFGFSSLQQHSKDIARQLAGPSFVPLLNMHGEGFASMEGLKGARGEAHQLMSKHLFSGFDRRHETAKTPYETMVHNMQQMSSKR